MLTKNLKLCLDNIDPLSEQYRKERNGKLYPTSYGDHMDRAIKSLGKEIGVAVSVDLANTQAVKVNSDESFHPRKCSPSASEEPLKRNESRWPSG